MEKRIFFIISLFIVMFIIPGYNNTKKNHIKVGIDIDSSDVDLFYSVLDKAREEGLELNGDYFYENYLTKGSPALKNIMDNIEDYAPVVNMSGRERELFWSDFEKMIDFLKVNKDEILKNRDYLMKEEPLLLIEEKLENFLDQDFNSTIYFTIGMGNRYGTATDIGIIMDVSMTRNENIDYSFHPYPQFNKMFPDEKDTTFMFVHELMHQFQRIGLKRDNVSKNQEIEPLSDIIINEGAGHFFAKILLGEKYLPKLYLEEEKYFKENPNIMKEMLDKKDVDTNTEEGGRITRTWFFNYLEERGEGVPPDMGYYLGSVIAEDYYHRAEDKKKAFIEIIEYWNYKDKLINSYIENNLR